MKKYRFRVGGFCVAVVLGSMAFAAVSTQAEVGSHWNVSGSAISATLLPAPEAEPVTNQTLLSKILGSSVEVVCEKMGLENAVLKTEGGSLGKIKFAGCTTKVNGVTQAACTPTTNTEFGVILTKLLKDLIVLEGGGVFGEGYDLIVPEEGSTFVTIEATGECSIGSKIPIFGTMTLKDSNLEGRVEKVTHLVEEGPGTELWVISKTVEHTARIDGIAAVFLIREHAGLKWSGTPA